MTESCHTPKRHHRKRFWLLVAAGVVVLIVCLPQVVLSLWGAPLLGQLLSQQLHTAVTLEEVRGGWWRGLELRHLTVAESPTPQAPLLMRMERMSLNLAFVPLLLSGKPVSARIDDVQINLRRRDDGQWNLAVLLARLTRPKQIEVSKPKTSKPFSLPDRRVDVALTGGRLSLGPDGATYTFDLQTGSPSLAQAPLQWQFALQGPEGAASTIRGQIQQLAGSELPEGHAEVDITDLDLDVITPLLRLDPAIQPQGVVRKAHLRFDLTGAQGLNVALDLDLRQVGLLETADMAKVRLDHLQMRVRGRWQDNQWSCDTLAIDAPGVRFALHDQAWLQADEEAWRGRVAFSLDATDIQPVARVLRRLLPSSLHVQDQLQIAAKADGRVSRKGPPSVAARLAGLEASLDVSLDSVTWQRNEFKDFAAKLDLQEGRLTIAQIAVQAFGGHVDVKGELPLAKDAPGGGIDWRVTNLPLHRVLGKPLKQFVISSASGRLTHDRKGYRVQTVVQFPEIGLDPAAIGKREFRVTRGVLRCTATFTLPFSHLAFDGCAIQSPEMRLALDHGKLELGDQPQVAMQIKGQLIGAFVEALVPEDPGQHPDFLTVRGPVMIRLKDNVWTGMQWRLAISAERYRFQEMTFTDLRLMLVKESGRLDILDLMVKRGSGRVTGTGGWRFFGKGRSAVGGLKLQTERVATQHTLMRDAAGEPSVIEAIVSGPTTVQTGKAGWQLTLDSHVHHMRVRRGAVTLAALSAARLHGAFGREKQGALWARQLEMLGDDLNVTLRHSRFPVQATRQATFEVDAVAEAEAAWVRSVLALFEVEGVEVSGRIRAVVQVQGKRQAPLDTLRGAGTVQVAEVSLRRQTITDVDVAYSLTPGRVQITKGAFGYQDGGIEVQGSLGLPPAIGTPGDRVVLSLKRLPIEHARSLKNFRKQGPATLSLRTLLNGQVELHTTPGGQLTGVVNVQVDKTTRQVRQADRVLEEVAVPALMLTTQVSSARPQERWELPHMRLQGQGTSVELTDVHVQRTPSHLDIGGALRVNLSGEASYALTMGVLPEAFEVKDAVVLSGRAGLRLPARGKIEPRHISYTGDVRLESLMIEGDHHESLTAQLKLDQGRLTVASARTALLDGELSVASPSFVDLQGPAHRFDVHVLAKDLDLRVYGGKRLALSRVLFLLAPLFILEPSQEEPTDMSGVFNGEMAVRGSFSQEPGWSKSVNGDGNFQIQNGAVVGSTLVAGMTTKAILLPWNLVHNTLTGMFAHNGEVGRTLVSLGKKAFVFKDIASPIEIRKGQLRLQPDFEVRSPEFSMVINGYSTLEGDLDYLVSTDLIERLRFGSITSLPNKIPVIGKVLRYINPFTLLEGVELEATVKGNALAKNEAGTSDVKVDLSMIREKKPSS